MKIGIDISPIFYQRGGVGMHTLHLVENLIRLKTGHRFFLYTSHLSDESFSFLSDPDVQLIHGLKPYLTYKIWKEKIDVVHGPNFRLPGRGTKGNILTIHDLALEKYPAFGKKKYGAKFSSWKTKKRALSADHIIAVSQNSLEDIVKIVGVPRERISAIYNGVDPFFMPDHERQSFLKIKEKYGIKKNQFILFTGTVEPRKNVKTLLKAFSRNRQLRKGCSLVLAGGKGWKNEDMQQFILNEGIQNELSITGYISREELRILYSFSACFVFPSIYEGFGMPILEAMACGAPVICSNSSSLPEVAGNAAITLDPLDVEGFSAWMETIITNEDLRRKLVQKGFERVKTFSWEEAARKTLKIYEKVLLNTSQF